MEVEEYTVDTEIVAPRRYSAFQQFFSKLSRGGYPLLIATALAMIWANLAPHGYHQTWHSEVSITWGHLSVSKSFAHLVDEALMALFFFYRWPGDQEGTSGRPAFLCQTGGITDHGRHRRYDRSGFDLCLV